MTDEFDEDEATNAIKLAVTVDGKITLNVPVDDGLVVVMFGLPEAVAFLKAYVDCLELAMKVAQMPRGMTLSPGGMA
jgi:hypothetical protein